MKNYSSRIHSRPSFRRLLPHPVGEVTATMNLFLVNVAVLLLLNVCVTVLSAIIVNV